MGQRKAWYVFSPPSSMSIPSRLSLRTYVDSISLPDKPIDDLPLSDSFLLETTPNPRRRNLGSVLPIRRLRPSSPLPKLSRPLYILLDHVRRLPRPPDPASPPDAGVPPVAGGKAEEG